jgi:hypothetical protein
LISGIVALHRILVRTFRKKKDALKHLEGSFVAALRAAIQDIGRSAIDTGIGDPLMKRRRDVLLLRQALSTIHRPTLDQYVAKGLTHQLHFDCTYFFESFHAIVLSSKFRFYDQTLQKLIIRFHNLWAAAEYHGGYAFSPNEYGNGFTLKDGSLWNDSYQETVDAMDKAYRELPDAFSALLDHVHHKYPEIDMDETDERAWSDNWPYISGSHVREFFTKKRPKRRGKKKKVSLGKFTL